MTEPVGAKGIKASRSDPHLTPAKAPSPHTNSAPAASKVRCPRVPNCSRAQPKDAESDLAAFVEINWIATALSRNIRARTDWPRSLPHLAEFGDAR
ncbi:MULTISPECIES: hypothetical protein [Mycobacterium ulcerans group]|uniref:hypothetical protein n=1 Tax=Mycobacterium ulcerans group TaxID=2993898 RepID=UPI00124714A1|nr:MULTISPECIES: hypothetical protein [Mycobacterium ulcerans group]